MRRLSLVVLMLLSISLGCRKADADPKQLQADLDEQLKQQRERMERDFVVVEAVYRRDLDLKNTASFDRVYKDLNTAMLPLLDDQKNTRFVVTNPAHGFRLTIAPVNDVESFGKKITWGKVLAYDPDKRTLLVEYDSPAAPRETWLDGAGLARELSQRKLEVKAYLARSYLRNEIAEVGQKIPEAQLVCLFAEETGAHPGLREARKAVEDILDGPAEKRQLGSVISGQGAGLVAGPVADLDAFAKKITFAKVLFVDGKRRVVILEFPQPKAKDAPKKGD